jgi:hypothetical protein
MENHVSNSKSNSSIPGPVNGENYVGTLPPTPVVDSTNRGGNTKESDIRDGQTNQMNGPNFAKTK